MISSLNTHGSAPHWLHPCFKFDTTFRSNIAATVSILKGTFLACILSLLFLVLHILVAVSCRSHYSGMLWRHPSDELACCVKAPDWGKSMPCFCHNPCATLELFHFPLIVVNPILSQLLSGFLLTTRCCVHWYSESAVAFHSSELLPAIVSSNVVSFSISSAWSATWQAYSS